MQTLEQKTTALQAFIVLYDEHTKMFYNVLDGISEKDATNRLGTKANHIAWIAGSLVYQRYQLIKMSGGKVDYKPNPLFENFQGIKDDAVYPSLDQYRKDWGILTPVLKETMLNLREEKLNGPDPFEMPGANYTFFDSLTFCIDRESYCIGQIGLYRRLLGYPPMKYT
jgi:hypothetical protein